MRTFLICALLGLGGALTAQTTPAPQRSTLHLRQRQQTNLTGIWVGELLQNPGGIAERFELTMQLRQNGVFMSGTAYVSYGELWAEMAFSGYELPNGSWKLTETEILRAAELEQLAWCMKEYSLQLNYTKQGLTLHGPWWGKSKFGSCVPGSIRLQKKKTRV